MKSLLHNPQFFMYVGVIVLSCIVLFIIPNLLTGALLMIAQLGCAFLNLAMIYNVNKLAEAARAAEEKKNRK